MAIRERRGGYEVLIYAGLDPLTGKQRYISRQVNGSRRKAEREEARLKTEVANGQHAGTHAKTFGDLLDQWLKWRVGNGKPISPSTIATYRSLIETKIKPALGSRPLSKMLDVRALDAFYEALRKRGNAWATVVEDQDGTKRPRRQNATKGLGGSRLQDVHAVISGALGLAARWGWLPYNPAKVVRPVASGSTTRETPTATQIKELFTAVVSDPEFETFLRVSAATGLRPGEVCAVRWVDLDLDAAELLEVGNIVTKGVPGSFQRRGPKTKGSDSALALDPGTAELLKAHRARCEELAREFDKELPPEAYVFAREPDGSKPMRPDAMSRRFAELRAQLGHTYTLYGLRHFMASQLGAFATAGTVRARMRHGSLTMTSAYMHPITEADRAAARFMGDLLDGRATWRVAPDQAGDSH